MMKQVQLLMSGQPSDTYVMLENNEIVRKKLFNENSKEVTIQKKEIKETKEVDVKGNNKEENKKRLVTALEEILHRVEDIGDQLQGFNYNFKLILLEERGSEEEQEHEALEDGQDDEYEYFEL